MRIERRLATLIAVLCGVLSAAGAAAAAAEGEGEAREAAREAARTPHDAGWSSNSSRVRRAPQPHHRPHRHPVQEETTMETVGAWKKFKWQEMQSTLRQEGYTPNGTVQVECCPSVLEMVEPKGGRNMDGIYVELYGDDDNKQRFFELSCRPDVVNMPCRFVDPRLLNQSLCVQKLSYTYALVRDSSAATEAPHRHRRGERHFTALPGSGGWSLDYIQVRSGCACEIAPPPLKRKRQGAGGAHGPHKHKRLQRARRPTEPPEDDET